MEGANATGAAPGAGCTPSITLVSDDETKYTATVESWMLVDGSSETELTASDKFESGKDYKINIRFTAKEGYQFDSDCTFTLNEKSTQAYVIGDPTSRRYYFNDVPAAGAATHTVSFDANGGTGTMAPATGISGEYTLPACTFTAPSGKQFKAWSVGGVEKAVGDKITVTANTTVTAVWEDIPVVTYTVAGTATSFGSDTDNVILQLIAEGYSEADYEVFVKGNTAEYSIEGVSAGTYTMKVMKQNHVTREYTVAVGSSNVVQDVKICLLGDVTGDGKVNTKDWNRIYDHVEETSLLTDYALACGDVNGDGKVNTKDWNRIYDHVEETNPLW